MSQAFTTGSHASGYVLTGVDIASASSTAFTAWVCGIDGDGKPTSPCTDLTAPAGIVDGTNAFTAPANTRLLSATTYAVVVSNGYFSGVAYGVTDADGEDTGQAANWSIANGSFYSSADNSIVNPGGANWTTSASALRIAIKGSNAADLPPTLDSATVNAVGKIITLEFNEAVEQMPTGLPPTNAFSVTADGNAVALQLASVGGVGVTDAIRLFVADSATIYTGQTVVVTYTDPSAGDDTAAVQDTAGNDAASFTTGTSGVSAVTNDSTVSNPDAPTIVSVAR